MKSKFFFFLTFISNFNTGNSVVHSRTKRDWNFNKLGNQLAQQDLYRRKSPVGGYLKSSHGKTSCCLSMCQQLEILDDTNVLKLSATWPRHGPTNRFIFKNLLRCLNITGNNECCTSKGYEENFLWLNKSASAGTEFATVMLLTVTKCFI